MEKYQNIIVVSVIAVFVVLIVGALVYTQSSGIESQRFRAAPGTERENAAPMYSQRTDRDSERSGTVKAPASSSGGTGGTATDSPALTNGDDDFAVSEPTWIMVPEESPAEIVDSPEPSSEAPAPLSGVALLLQEAMVALDPAKGLARLAAGAAAIDAMDATAEIYTTAAQLFMSLDPPDPESAMDALARAKTVATTPDEQGEVVLLHAQMLYDAGESERAIGLLEGALMAEDPATVASVRGRLQLAGYYEKAERAEDLLAALEHALTEAEGLVAADAPGAEGCYRQVCLRLSRYYRGQGQDGDADRVLTRMQELLGVPEAPREAI